MSEKHVCSVCGANLRTGNLGTLCRPCQKSRLTALELQDSPNYSKEEMRILLGLKTSDQVRRLSRKGLIPGRVPGIKAHLFRREVVDAWIRAGGEGFQIVGGTSSPKVSGSAAGGQTGIPCRATSPVSSPPSTSGDPAYPLPITALTVTSGGISKSEDGIKRKTMFGGLRIIEIVEELKRASARPPAGEAILPASSPPSSSGHTATSMPVNASPGTSAIRDKSRDGAKHNTMFGGLHVREIFDLIKQASSQPPS